MKQLSVQAEKLKNKLAAEQKYIRGLYSGGTLCYEAQIIWKKMLKEPVYSNAPLEKKYLIDIKNTQHFHTTLDLGEEEFTVGRPHPMIDNDLRTRYIIAARSDPTTAVIILDVVIGYGAHADPGQELGDAIRRAKKEAGDAGRTLHVITCVTGTENDPQGLKETKAKLKDAGAVVCDTNAQSARLAALITADR
jgi:FdrA protein